MHDEREWRQCAAAAEVAGAGERKDLALSSCNSDHTSDDARGTTDCEFRAATDTVPITPGWDQRPGADLLHSAQLSRKTPRTLLVSGGKIRTVFLEAVASDSTSILRLCLLAGTIVMAFGLGWFCGSTWSPSRTAGKETLSRTARLLLPGLVPHRHLHHLDRAASKSELHPHERAGPRPGNEIVGCGDEEPLVVQLALDVSEKRINDGACVPTVRGNQRVVRRHDRGFAQFHSSAPFVHIEIYPIVNMARRI